MPRYPWLLTQKIETNAVAPRIAALRKVGVPYPQAAIGVVRAEHQQITETDEILSRTSREMAEKCMLHGTPEQIERYLAEWNTHPTPFVWTKDPAAIIKKALRRGPGR
jgi:cbb3-type cytochrome oxidase cytochrome c subunit